MNNQIRGIKLKNFVLDLIFPRFCFGCGREGEWLCRSCQKKILFVKTQVCPKCHRISPSGKFCQKCRKVNELTGIIVACYFEEGPVRELIHNFKYNNILELGDVLGKILADTLLENMVAKNNYFISFTPLYWLREKSRGYNQAEVLAKVVSHRTKIPFAKTLTKLRPTKRQVDLKGSERRKNLKNVFTVRPDIDVTKKTIILVDDITTTGATLSECAKVLRQSGARRIWGLVVARG